MQESISISLMVVFLGLAVTLWSGCGADTWLAQPPPSTKPVPESGTEEGPEWFFNVPEDPDYVYAAVVAESDILQRAMDMVGHHASVEMARQVRTRIEQFITEAGVVTTERISGVTLRGCEKVKQEVIKKGSMYRAYVLTGMPMEEVKVATLAAIEADQELHTELKDLPKFKELVKEVEEYKKKREENSIPR